MSHSPGCHQIALIKISCLSQWNWSWDSTAQPFVWRRLGLGRVVLAPAVGCWFWTFIIFLSLGRIQRNTEHPGRFPEEFRGSALFWYAKLCLVQDQMDSGCAIMVGTYPRIVFLELHMWKHQLIFSLTCLWSRNFQWNLIVTNSSWIWLLPVALPGTWPPIPKLQTTGFQGSLGDTWTLWFWSWNSYLFKEQLKNYAHHCASRPRSSFTTHRPWSRACPSVSISIQGQHRRGAQAA